MRKSVLWTTIGFGILGIISFVVYLALDLSGIYDARMVGYLCWFGYIVLVWLPILCEWLLKVKFNFVIIVSFEIFLVATLIVGTQWSVYGLFKPLDKIVHFASGILIAFIAYELFSLSKINKVNMFWLFFIVFSVSMMCGGIWEIWEFTFDGLLGNDSQNAGDLVGRAALFDTMWDLICDFFGSILGGIFVLLMEKKKQKAEKE